jgi:hypothetical protein
MERAQQHTMLPLQMTYYRQGWACVESIQTLQQQQQQQQQRSMRSSCLP